MPDIPSVRERVLQGWASHIASELSTAIERNRRSPVSLEPNEQKLVFVDGDEESFEEGDALNIVSRVIRWTVEIYLRADLASIGPRLNDLAAQVEQIVYLNRGLSIALGEPELCSPSNTILLGLEFDPWRQPSTEPGGSIALTFQCVYSHPWDNPYESAN